jgi:hypothetical protein
MFIGSVGDVGMVLVGRVGVVFGVFTVFDAARPATPFDTLGELAALPALARPAVFVVLDADGAAVPADPVVFERAVLPLPPAASPPAHAAISSAHPIIAHTRSTLRYSIFEPPLNQIRRCAR